ncbi:hypothetical protein [Pseudoalteromonas sp. Of7M-16]|uniref:hypothetical protein n=1 Tax=Pseudoalteromonas sp. Of7M-16 TaxID=2917756 RepID=UPI001EF667AA|nr:hypothetical protein [Pseudoalteromonas sp. Of7M-16]MCG7550099.1 hypothetical protein [Pseudoalteromonas sp. Of7M-16]
MDLKVVVPSNSPKTWIAGQARNDGFDMMCNDDGMDVLSKNDGIDLLSSNQGTDLLQNKVSICCKTRAALNHEV